MLGQSGNENVRLEQASFWGEAPKRRGGGRFDERARSNLFLAVVPEQAAAHQACEIGHRLGREHRLSHTPRPLELLHVTLNPIGSYMTLSEADVFTVSDAMASVRAAPFEASFDRAASFSHGDRKLLVLGSAVRSEELMDLHVQLAKEMWGAGMTFTYNPRFMPHMTLSYGETAMPETMLAEPVRWMVREVVLIHSLVGEGRYEYLGRWPLSDDLERRAVG
ncbi:2'-5' RNA ligase [Pararhizobium capsulatum DSM 1112]|uniref:2'-5' RNA ligase n=1 Tax=Pararhizobium capsulatum DSM 1112 TaxID=1121113 RepID=A0ABU0BLQ5_9HYPH|nr:2'-5' RNA ligase family protein [Pararhizobium capsulatum]MDQ0318684.1 2'-5' RNA ligase [Pararhizobium capsulatum DSM 1112]